MDDTECRTCPDLLCYLSFTNQCDLVILNGLSLGMIWGLVFSYLEGRKTTELLGAVLSVTFILASGLVRTVAKWLMVGIQVSEMWMPAVTSAIFLPLLVISVLCLNSLPALTASDQEARQKIPR